MTFLTNKYTNLYSYQYYYHIFPNTLSSIQPLHYNQNVRLLKYIVHLLDLSQ